MRSAHLYLATDWQISPLAACWLHFDKLLGLLRPKDVYRYDPILLGDFSYILCEVRTCIFTTDWQISPLAACWIALR